MTGPRLSIIPAAAAEDQAVSAPAYRLLGLLAAHADKNGYCYPSVGRLAEKSGLGERWVKRLLNDLVATPYLAAAKRPGRSTVYQVITKRVVPQTTRELSDHRSHGPPPGGPTVPKGVVPQTTHNDTSNDKPNDTDIAFKEFWRIYPSRGDNKPNPKKPARAKFFAAVKSGTDPADILRGVENFVAAEQASDTEPRFIPMAITWLNQGRWEGYQVAPSIGRKESDPQPRSMNAI